MTVLIECVIFGGLAYWLFRDRARAIVDLISTKFQEVYNGWEARGKLHQKKDKTSKDKYTSEAQTRAKNKLDSKKPTGLNCDSCGPSNRGSLVRVLPTTKPLDILQVDGVIPRNGGLLNTYMPRFWQTLNIYVHKHVYVYDSVLKDERIQEVYETAARQALGDSEVSMDTPVFMELLEKQKTRAAKILTSLRCTFSCFILRLSFFVMSYVWLKLFSNVTLHPDHIKLLQKADSTNLPLIFLPLHRSHLDYIIITYILGNYNMKSPMVAAGENLKMPFFGSLLRGLGAFFIKRRMDQVNGKRDVLYRAVLHTYMIHSLRAGHHFEFFLEGTRTRSGKPCMPKGGLLSVFLDAYMDCTIEDALLVPVSINYDRIVDGNFTSEQLGQPKKMETFFTAVTSIWKLFSSHYGSMRIDINQPFSLSEMVNTFQNKNSPVTATSNIPSKKLLRATPSTASLYGTDVVVEEHRQLVNSIARHVIYDCSCSTAIMSTNAVSFLLLNVFRKGVQLEDLTTAFDHLRENLIASNKSLGFNGPSIEVIEKAIKILGPDLISVSTKSEGEFIAPVTVLPNVLELSYYGNALLPHYVLEAVIVKSFNSLQRKSETNQVSHKALMETTRTLCDILQYEFIFTKYCQDLDDVIMSTIDSLISQKILFQETIPAEENYENTSPENEISQQNVQYTKNADPPHAPFQETMLRPIFDVYMIAFRQLHRLLSNHITEKDIVQVIMGTVEKELRENKIEYGESMSVDTIKNALKLLEKWTVVDSYNKQRVKYYSLGERFDDEPSLNEVISRIERFN
uniref:Phospholipid/glycerol acyltransferase domain-containing protein n=2 Tax=Clastoptera arizonana TaxID=38151 RepID=A0A1B6DIG6_9HEMI